MIIIKHIIWHSHDYNILYNLDVLIFRFTVVCLTKKMRILRTKTRAYIGVSLIWIFAFICAGPVIFIVVFYLFTHIAMRIHPAAMTLNSLNCNQYFIVQYFVQI